MNEAHWVYVLYAPKANTVKVGRSAHEDGARNRIQTHQTSSGEPLHLLATFLSTEHYTERELHRRLKQWRSHGEWFNATTELRDTIKQLLNIIIPRAHTEPELTSHRLYNVNGRWCVTDKPFDVTFTSRINGHTKSGSLIAYYYVNYESITDDYDLDEISAFDLYKRWRALAEKRNEDTIEISWTVAGCGTFDPHPLAQHHWTRIEPYNKTWVDIYTDPWRTDGEPFRWLDLPIVYKRWNAQYPQARDKGGFIEELTGWRPAPLQPFLNLRQIDALVGMSVAA